MSERSDAIAPAPGWGPAATAPKGIWRFVRGVFVLIAAWSVTAIFLTLVVLFALLTLRRGVNNYTHWVGRVLGRYILALTGIDLHVEGLERIAGRHARIIALNHTSQLDMFVVLSILPVAASGLAKREMYRIPFIGWAFWALRVPTVDRGDHDKAVRSVDVAARRLVDERLSMFLSPEGTRSRDGKLQPFKMGPFHLAAASKAPLIPAIIEGAQVCQPRGTFIPSPGRIRLRFLAPIDTSDWAGSDLHARRDDLRTLFLRELGEDD